MCGGPPRWPLLLHEYLLAERYATHDTARDRLVGFPLRDHARVFYTEIFLVFWHGFATGIVAWFVEY